MPTVTWKGPDGQASVEQGKVVVMAKLLFVNGIKKRKLADLQAPPERGPDGEVVLRFGESDACAVKFESRRLGDEFAQQALGAAPATRSSSGSMGNWEKAVREAVGRAGSRPFASPLPSSTSDAFSQVPVPAAQAWRLLAEVCAAWEAADSRRSQVHRDAVAAATAERDASAKVRQRVEGDCRDMETKLREAEERVGSLEKARKFQAEEAAASKQLLAEGQRADVGRLRFLEGEVASLRQRLKESVEDKTPPKPARVKRHRVAPPAKPDDTATVALARHMAELEAAPLRRCPEPDRPELRKSLQKKWSAREQPSVELAAFAPHVLEALEAMPEWRGS